LKAASVMAQVWFRQKWKQRVHFDVKCISLCVFSSADQMS